MKLEAIKTENGFFIPMNDILSRIREKKIVVEFQIVESYEKNDYSSLDQIIGLCETGKTDASVSHDRIVYGEKER